MSCYYNKQLLSTLGLSLLELDTDKKCQVSLVVKYTLILHRLQYQRSGTEAIRGTLTVHLCGGSVLSVYNCEKNW